LVAHHTESQVGENPAFPYALIGPSDISAQILAHWLDRANLLGSLPAGVASVWQGSLAVETQVLILTTIAEGLHRALNPDRVRFTPDHGKIVQNVATAAVREIDPAAAKAVHGLLNHVYEPCFGTRLQQLAARAEELVPGITGQSNRWKNLVYDTRNEYAHKPSTEWMSEADIGRVITVAESLRWVLRLLLLDQAGLDSQLITASFRDSQRYSFFLRDAAAWQPKIYGDPSGSA
jgi:Apea-like HEPN